MLQPTQFIVLAPHQCRSVQIHAYSICGGQYISPHPIKLCMTFSGWLFYKRKFNLLNVSFQLLQANFSLTKYSTKYDCVNI